jgi:AcrR family transcriptional regulator
VAPKASTRPQPPGPPEPPVRPLRADARRNRDRILDTAQQAFSDHGPHLSLDEIAARAGVSPATLFRHFANRDELVAAVVERRFATEVDPVVARAVEADDPWQGLVAAFDAILHVGADSRPWRETMLVAKEAGLVTELIRDRFYGPVGVLLERARRAGTVRGDVTVDDLRPITRMLRALVTTSSDPTDDEWRRYLSLLLRAPTTTSSKRSVEK